MADAGSIGTLGSVASPSIIAGPVYYGGIPGTERGEARANINGTISGGPVTISGVVVANCEVWLTSLRDRAFRRMTLTDSSGMFSFVDLDTTQVYTVDIYDPTTTYNAKIFDRVTPA